VIVELKVVVEDIYTVCGVPVTGFYRVAPCVYIPKDWVHVIFTHNGKIDALGVDTKYLPYCQFSEAAP